MNEKYYSKRGKIIAQRCRRGTYVVEFDDHKTTEIPWGAVLGNQRKGHIKGFEISITFLREDDRPVAGKLEG